MRDEEDLNNSPEQPDDEQPGAAREATPQEQKMFDTLAKQALHMLMSEQATEMIIAGAKAKGAEQAIADAVIQVLQVAVQSAAAAGIQVPEEVIDASAQPAVRVLCKACEQAGFVEDADDSTRQVMQLVSEGLEGGEPASEEPDADDAGPTPEQEF